jgi:hypothetical protein
MNGTSGANFTITISSGTITLAQLHVTNQPVVTLAFTNREVVIPNLPAGDSLVELALAWLDGEPNAIVDIGTITSGTVAAPSPKAIIDDNSSVGYVKLFGK